MQWIAVVGMLLPLLSAAGFARRPVAAAVSVIAVNVTPVTTTEAAVCASTANWYVYRSPGWAAPWKVCSSEAVR